MTYEEFAKQVYVIRRCQTLKPRNLLDRRCIERTASVFVSEVEKAMSDTENNLRLWLNGKPCCYTHPKTKNTIRIRIGDSTQAIYHFLLFCQGLKEGTITDIGYIAFLITSSNNERSNACQTM